ncbi:MAG: hypothetical protein KF701_01650 [Anaerolineales bacterium]|nr:MAG: hypothetical protein KF701_01650 [Anaerolineales bacterium]
MPTALDLFVVPLYRRNGQDQAYLPGVHLLAAPRRAARGRAGERLVLQLTLPPEITLSADQQHALLGDLAEGYFRTAGSVTAALRDQIDRLNTYFLQLNQRGQSGGAPARLAAISVREERVTLAHVGPQHGFVLNGGIEHLYDAPASGRGLGMGSHAEVRFYQAELSAADCLLLVPDVPSGWNEKTLANVSGQKLSTLRRRFLSEAGADLRAVMLMAQPGSGRLSLMTSFDDGTAAARPQAPLPQPATHSAPPAAQPQPAPLSQAPAGWEQLPAPEHELEETGAFPPYDPPAEPASQLAQPTYEQEWPVYQEPEEPGGFSVLIDEISTRARKIWQRVSPGLRSFMLRLLPDEPVFNLPRQTLAIIAIVVPLAVVILVSVIYLQFGRVQLYENYLAQAQSAAALAQARENPVEVRQAWSVAVHYAERASAYEQDAQAAAELLAQARLALDDLDFIERMNFQPALFTNLPRATNITQMVADNRDLYMLDGASGKVLRAFLTSSGYQLDDSFSCEPGPYGGYIVSELIDIALLPSNHPQGASLAAMDGNGNLIFCFVGERPLAITLLPPDSHWGKPTAIAIENSNLYVLDPITNAVWIYFGEGGSFPGAPRFFFGAQVPSMQQAIDIVLEGNTLYILKQNGRVAECVFNDDLENPTTCTDPLEFVDTRPGQQSGPTVAGANFSQLFLTDPPGPSLFFLDPIVPSIYQFSTRLGMSRQLRAQSELPEGLVSAFTISPNRFVFLAFKNQVYFGPMP